MVIFRKNTKRALVEIEKVFHKHRAGSVYFGGFAAKLYGANRPLADIDVYVDEDKVDEVAQVFKKYIICGPKEYRDKNWIAYMFTMRYKEQDVDVCGKKTIRIFDMNNRKWVQLPTGNRFSIIKFAGVKIKVVKKDDLIKYKLKLRRRVDRSDVRDLSE